MTIEEILNQTIEFLQKIKKWDRQESSQIARRLLAYTLKKDKTYLIINKEKKLQELERKQFEEYIKKIEEGMPIQYLLHQQEFMGWSFQVEEDVLIPQPDTEILVEETIHKIEEKKEKEKIEILDIGTRKRSYWNFYQKRISRTKNRDFIIRY